ncbi:MAG: proline iminopeptidase-family hydrolase [Actinomycetes bacterium]
MSGPVERELRLDLLPELGSTWCRDVGEAGTRPALVLLHGGPGYNCEYLRRFEQFAHTGRRVVRYDQIGSGRSAVGDEHYVPGTFSVDVFRRELAALRRELGLTEVVLVGQSWGCMLALEHVLAGAEGVRGLVLMSGLASIEEWNAETLRLRSELPADVLVVLEAEEAAGRVGSPAFKKAYAVWERTHVLRMDDPPPWEAEALAMFEHDSRVYDLLTGGAEFPTGGTMNELQDWDVRPRLHEVLVPTLLLSGRYDEATPAVMSTLQRGIAGSERLVLEESSHSCHTEQEALTMLLVADFLARIETRTE